MNIYVLCVETPNVPQTHFVAKPALGRISRYLADARTWKTPGGARRFMQSDYEISVRRERGARVYLARWDGTTLVTES